MARQFYCIHFALQVELLIFNGVYDSLIQLIAFANLLTSMLHFLLLD